MCSPDFLFPRTHIPGHAPGRYLFPPDELRWYVFPLHVDMCFPWLCVPFASILVHALVYSVSCRFSLSKEETWRFSGLLIAGPACSVISWSSSCSRHAVLNLVWCPFLLPVVLLCWRPTTKRQQSEGDSEWHNHGSSHSGTYWSWCQHWGIHIQYHNMLLWSQPIVE